MPSELAWLPPRLVLDEIAVTAYGQCYTIFVRDFHHGKPKLHGLPVKYSDQFDPADPRFPIGFLHLIEREKDHDGKRWLDRERAERLPWLKAVLDNAYDPAVSTFVNRGRTYLWLEEFDYVVVLKCIGEKARRSQAYRLITAYHLDGESDRRSLRQKKERGDL